MADRNVPDDARRCKTCVSLDRVNDRHEHCRVHHLTVLGEDAACASYTSTTPWANWLLTEPLIQAHKADGE